MVISQSRPKTSSTLFDNGEATLLSYPSDNSLQPCNITTAPHTAGAAGLNGERIKDATHGHLRVSASGGSFVALVAKTL